MHYIQKQKSNSNLNNLTSRADEAFGTDILKVGSGVEGRDSSLTGGPARECALKNVAELGRGVLGFWKIKIFIEI